MSTYIYLPKEKVNPATPSTIRGSLREGAKDEGDVFRGNGRGEKYVILFIWETDVNKENKD